MINKGAMQAKFLGYFIALTICSLVVGCSNDWNGDWEVISMPHDADQSDDGLYMHIGSDNVITYHKDEDECVYMDSKIININKNVLTWDVDGNIVEVGMDVSNKILKMEVLYSEFEEEVGREYRLLKINKLPFDRDECYHD